MNGSHDQRRTITFVNGMQIIQVCALCSGAHLYSKNDLRIWELFSASRNEQMISFSVALEQINLDIV